MRGKGVGVVREYQNENKIECSDWSNPKQYDNQQSEKNELYEMADLLLLMRLAGTGKSIFELRRSNKRPILMRLARTCK